MTATYIAIGVIAFLLLLGFCLCKIASRMDGPEASTTRDDTSKPLTLDDYNEMLGRFKEFERDQRVIIIPESFRRSEWGAELTAFADANPDVHWSEYADKIVSIPKCEFFPFRPHRMDGPQEEGK